MEHVLATERETLKLRLLALAAALAGLYYHQDEVPLAPALILAVSYLLYALLLRTFIIPRLGGAYVVYGMMLVDAAAMTAALHLAGGIRSAIFILFPLFVIYYAIYFGYLSSFSAATIISVAFVGYAVFSRQAPAWDPFVALQVPLFYLLAAFSGYLARKEIKERGEKEALQELVRAESGASSLLEMAMALHSSLDLGVILQDMVGKAPQLFGLSHSLVALLDERGENLVGKATNLDLRALGLKEVSQLVEPAQSGSLAALALSEERPISGTTGETQGLPHWAEGFGSFLLIPLSLAEKRLGLIYLFEPQEGKAFGESELRLARGLGDLAARAIANAMVYQEGLERITQEVRELQGIIRRMQRRKEPQRKRVINVNGLLIDPTQKRVLVEGRPVELSPTEFEVLYCLAENAGIALNQDLIFRRVWGEVYRGQTNVVDVCVHRLRRKIESDPSSPKRILTLRGLGYMLSEGKAGS